MSFKSDISLTDIAYVAGVLDGEGCISMSVSSQNSSQKPYYNTSVCISNTNEKLICWLATTFDGGVFAKHGPHHNCKACWQAIWYGARAHSFLAIVYPYLRIKKKQARIMLNFRQIYDDTLRIRGIPRFNKGNPIPTGINILRKATYKKLKSLNAFGASWLS